jgi:hypothetical protein
MPDAGNTERVKVTFTNVDTGALFDPTTVVFTVYSPTGATTTPTPSHDSVGKWSVQFVTDVGGTWVVVVRTTGPVCAAQRRIPVNPVPLT